MGSQYQPIIMYILCEIHPSTLEGWTGVSQGSPTNHTLSPLQCLPVVNSRDSAPEVQSIFCKSTSLQKKSEWVLPEDLELLIIIYTKPKLLRNQSMFSWPKPFLFTLEVY